MPVEPKTILVVDDEPLVLNAVKMMLSYEGHVVEAVSNATEALAAFARDKFDLVITDYWMPGMKGDELAKAIKAQAPQRPVPVILLTAHAPMIEATTRDSNLFDLVVAKPFRREDLRAAITQVLGSNSSPLNISRPAPGPI